MARRYAEKKDDLGWRNRREHALIERAVEGVPAAGRIRDLPCGTGRIAIQLSRRGFSLEAADASAHMPDAVRDLAAQQGAGAITFSVRDLLCTGYPQDAFDAVICNRLLHHYRSADARTDVLRELRRISRGPVIAFYFLRTPLSVLSFDPCNRILGRRPRDRVPVSRAQLEREAAAAGLRVRHIRYVRRLFPPQCYVVLKPADRLLFA